MTVLHVDSSITDEERRHRLHAGDLFVYPPTPHSAALVTFARELAEAAFAPYSPPEAQHHLPAVEYVRVLAGLKPTFINHPRSAELVCGVLTDLGVDPEQTYFDVPRLRSMTSEYLNAGLTLQFGAHRDTWFAAPMCQLNYWIPVYEVGSGDSMAIYPRFFDTPVRNSSRDYDYARWVRHGRTAAAAQVRTESRRQPELEQELGPEPDLRIVTPPGGILIFSGAQLHATVPNRTGRTRFSIDFRAVNVADLRSSGGARNLDAACTGTTLGDFRRLSDRAPLPAELITEAHHAGPVEGATTAPAGG